MLVRTSSQSIGLVETVPLLACQMTGPNHGVEDMCEIVLDMEHPMVARLGCFDVLFWAAEQICNGRRCVDTSRALHRILLRRRAG